MIFRDIHRRKRAPLRLETETQESSAIPLPPKKIPVRDVNKGVELTVRLQENETVSKTIQISPLQKRIDQRVSNFSSPPLRTDSYSFLRHPLFSYAVIGLGIFTLLLLLIPYGKGTVLQERIKTYASNAFTTLSEASRDLQQGRVNGARQLIEEAYQDFADASLTLNRMSEFSRFLALEKTDTQPLYVLLQAGNDFATGAKTYSDGLGKIMELVQNLRTKTSEENYALYPSITAYLRTAFNLFALGKTHIHTGLSKMQQVDASTLPMELQDQFLRLQSKLQSGSDLLDTVQTQLPLLLQFLGDGAQKRYVILLQNQDEIRPTGGFIGSLFFFTVENGWVTWTNFKDVYDLEDKLKEVIPPPYPLSLISGGHGLRDSNTFADFRLSAQSAMEFLAKEGAPPVDGVFAMNQQVLLDLLQITGPVTVPEMGYTFDQDNFSFLMSYIVESKLLSRVAPKDILGKFITAFVTKLQHTEPMAVLDVLLQHLAQRTFAVYFTDPALENVAEQYGLAGTLAPLPKKQDALLLTATSVSGNKSDRYMDMNVQHETFIDNEGRIVDRLALEREHTFSSAEEEKWAALIQKWHLPKMPDWLPLTLGKGENVVYVRAYVPEGSVLLDSVGIDPAEVRMETESGRTVFGTLMRTYPGNTRKVILSYQLPYVLDPLNGDTYRFVIEKQVGGKNLLFQKNLSVGNDLVIKTTFPEGINEPQRFQTSTILENSFFFSVLIGER